MKKRNLKLYFTFAIIILALAVFFTIDSLSFDIETTEKGLAARNVVVI